MTGFWRGKLTIQIQRRVRFEQLLFHRVVHNIGDIVFQPGSDLQKAFALHLTQRDQQILRFDLFDKAIPDIRENIHFQPTHNGFRIMLRPAFMLAMPVRRDLAERLPIFPFLFLRLLYCCRIDTCMNVIACSFAQAVGLQQRDLRVGAKGQLFLFPVDTVLHIPEF